MRDPSSWRHVGSFPLSGPDAEIRVFSQEAGLSAWGWMKNIEGEWFPETSRRIFIKSHELHLLRSELERLPCVKAEMKARSEKERCLLVLERGPSEQIRLTAQPQGFTLWRYRVGPTGGWSPEVRGGIPLYERDREALITMIRDAERRG